MTMQAAPTLTLRNADDILAAIPFLLGFRPAASLVTILLNEGRIRLTARFDDEVAVDPELLTQQFAVLSRQFPDDDIISVAYTTDQSRGWRCIENLANLVSQQLLHAVVVMDDRYFEADCFCTNCRGTGTRFDDRSSAVAADAVMAGMIARDSRDDLRAIIAPPRGATLEVAQATAANTAEKLATMSVSARGERAGELVERLRIGQPLVPELLIELGLLVGDIAVRDRLWLKFRRDTADLDVALWAAVVRALPPEHSVPALCLAGMAAWLIGNGALQVVCLERGQTLRPDYSMLELLDNINLFAAPPDVWDAMVE